MLVAMRAAIHTAPCILAFRMALLVHGDSDGSSGASFELPQLAQTHALAALMGIVHNM